jgi:hypothetical protein
MKNNNTDYEVALSGYTNRLLLANAKKLVLEQMIQDLSKQLDKASDDAAVYWRERQQYINEHEEELAAS